MAVTIGVFTPLRLVISEVVRSHYLTAITKTYSLVTGYVPGGSYLQLNQGVLGPTARWSPPTARDHDGVPAAVTPPPPARAHGSQESERRGVLPMAHGYHGFVTYQPASRYWAFQGIETGIL